MSSLNIEEDDGYFLITMPYDEDAKEALKDRFRARWNPEEKCWRINSRDYSIQEVEAELKLHFPKEFR